MFLLNKDQSIAQRNDFLYKMLLRDSYSPRYNILTVLRPLRSSSISFIELVIKNEKGMKDKKVT